MAATGKTPILLYGSTTATNTPSAGNLTNSSDGCEIAINVADKNLFFKDSTNVVNTVPIRQSSASSNGWLSSTDWTTFNSKAPALTYTTNYVPYGQGTTTPALSSSFTFDGTTLTSPAHSLSSGNIAFSGSAQRITGLMDGTPVANRLAFQTSTTNAQTNLTVIPNGTSTATSLSLEGDSSVVNGSILQFICNVGGGGTESRITSGIRGTGTYLPLTIYAGGSERMRWFTSGGVSIGNTTDPGASNLSVTGTVTGATHLTNTAASMGYTTGAGGTVTQATNKSTGVTLNKPTGQITMNNAALGAGAVVAFTFTNSIITDKDVLMITQQGYVSGANYRIWCTVGAGSASIYVNNISGGSLSDALVLNFAVIKVSSS